MGKKLVFSFLLFLTFFFLQYGTELSLQLEKVAEVGSSDPILDRIYNIAEDRSGNFYIIDRKMYKVHKFSPEGDLLLSIGQKGEGPGDLKRPFRVFVSDMGEIIVSDISNIISYFDNKGKFLSKHNVGSLGFLLAFSYAGEKMFFAQNYSDDIPSLVLINLKPEFINKKILESFKHNYYQGKGFSISFGDKEFTPKLYTTHYGKLSVVAKGEEYKILILNSNGKIIREISKNIKRSRMSSKERERFANEIRAERKYSTAVKEGIINIIPYKKNIIGGLAISDKYILVERIKDDVSDMEAPGSVDVYDLNGKFLGELKMKHFPLLMTDSHIYTKEKDEDENLIAVKYVYKLNLAK